jgi:hypothetical protein
MKPTPQADITLTYPLAPNETRAEYTLNDKVLSFNTPASGQVIKLTGTWPCTIIDTKATEVTLDLGEFIAPDLVHILGN